MKSKMLILLVVFTVSICFAQTNFPSSAVQGYSSQVTKLSAEEQAVEAKRDRQRMCIIIVLTGLLLFVTGGTLYAHSNRKKESGHPMTKHPNTQ